ncbi:anaerobic ribonucleoside-triphosphate reductase activating protein [Eubacterium sp.]
MDYLQITHEDVCNGDGLRVVLWLSGCSHHCHNCQNPQTWNPESGIPFDESAKQEIFNELSKDYISGITFSGGDPLHENNLDEVLKLVQEIRNSFPNKTIWLYTGYSWSDIFRGEPSAILQQGLNNYKRREIIKLCDVVVDGRYIDEQKDLTLKFRGSKNQRVINVPESLKQGKVVLYCD